MASAISAQYLATVKIASAKIGGRPPFDELMKVLQDMEQDLAKAGAAFIEEHAAGNGVDKEQLTEDTRQLIATTIEAFIKQL